MIDGYVLKFVNIYFLHITLDKITNRNKKMGKIYVCYLFCRKKKTNRAYEVNGRIYRFCCPCTLFRVNHTCTHKLCSGLRVQTMRMGCVCNLNWTSLKKWPKPGVLLACEAGPNWRVDGFAFIFFPVSSMVFLQFFPF